MRNKVIAFLKSPEGSPEETFNQAIMLYMKADTPNPGILRSHNVQGYSPQRLAELLYDLKQAFDISDSDLIVAETPDKKVINLKDDKGEALPEGMPTFSKGAKGSNERKAYLKEHDLTSESFSHANMDKAIITHLRKIQADKAAKTYAEEKATITIEIAEKQIAGESLSEEQLKAVQEKLAMTDEEFDNFMMIDVVKAMAVDHDLVKEFQALIDSEEFPSDELVSRIAESTAASQGAIQKIQDKFREGIDELVKKGLESYNKVVDLIKANEIPPTSLIREIYGDAEMSDENAQAILVEATAFVNGSGSEGEKLEDNNFDFPEIQGSEPSPPKENETPIITETSKSDTEKK